MSNLSLKKLDLNIIPEEERDKALEHYMKRCFQLEEENLLLKKQIKTLDSDNNDVEQQHSHYYFDTERNK